MRFEADLDLLVDGARAHVRSDGAALIVETAHPAALVGTLRRAARPRAQRRLALLADRLAGTGASIRVEGPRGLLLTVGADADAPALRLLTGTRHVAPGSVGGALSLAASILDRRRRRWAGVLAAVALALITAARSRRSR